LIDAEPRLKVLSDGRVDARVLAAFAALYAGDTELANTEHTDRESLNAARKDIALRCEQLIRTVQKQSGAGEAEEMLLAATNNNNNTSEKLNVIDAYRRHKMWILRDCVSKLRVEL